MWGVAFFFVEDGERKEGREGWRRAKYIKEWSPGAYG